ncbi:MAG: putative DNA-binding domain-containing protein [Pseudomonadota bacterium]
MSDRGRNQPEFQSLQFDLTTFVRSPDAEPAPTGQEARRLQIYVDLIFNNIENFLATTFPVAKSTFADTDWRALVRDYIARHRATSPFFLEIPQEFLEFLATRREQGIDPPWLLELCHYEWVELELDTRQAEAPALTLAGDIGTDLAVADALGYRWALSELCWPLGYRYPVHRIGAANAAATEASATFLIVYRDDALRVRFIESDAPTVRLLALLSEGHTLSHGLSNLAQELSPRRDVGQWLARMAPVLVTLHARGVVLGPLADEPDELPAED